MHINNVVYAIARRFVLFRARYCHFELSKFHYNYNGPGPPAPPSIPRSARRPAGTWSSDSVTQDSNLALVCHI